MGAGGKKTRWAVLSSGYLMPCQLDKQNHRWTVITTMTTTKEDYAVKWNELHFFYSASYSCIVFTHLAFIRPVVHSVKHWLRRKMHDVSVMAFPKNCTLNSFGKPTAESLSISVRQGINGSCRNHRRFSRKCKNVLRHGGTCCNWFHTHR